MSRDTESYANQLGKMEERPHRTRSSIVAAVLAAMLMVPSLDVRANCQDLVDDNIYLCRVKNDVDLRFSDCFRFAAPGSQSEDFDLFSDALDGVLACDCKATGNLASPVFGAANSLHCVTPSGLGLALEGAVRRTGRIIVGQAVNEVGTSFSLRCRRVPSCELPATTLEAPAASW